MIVEEQLYKGTHKKNEIKRNPIIWAHKNKKKMNKHFYMTPLKMKRKATFLYGLKKMNLKKILLQLYMAQPKMK